MAPVKCYYYDCTNTSTTKSMFTFPIKDYRRLNLWIKHSGNTNLESLTDEELKCRYICEDHFEAGDVVKHDRRSRLAHTAVPLLYTPVIAQDDDLILNKPEKVYKTPEQRTAIDRGTILVFDLGPCEDCGQPIKRFQWWCLQCGGARCLQCAQRMTHNAHLLLRAAAGGMDEKTRAIMEIIREQLQIETVQVKEEIENEETENTQVENDEYAENRQDTENDQSENEGETENGQCENDEVAENGVNTENDQSENEGETENSQVDDDEDTDNEDRLALEITPEPEIEIEPHSLDLDPLAVKPEPDENRRRPCPTRRGKRSPELDYRPLNPHDRQVLDHPFLGAELPCSEDIMDMNDFYGGFWPQDKRTRFQLHHSNNEENFSHTEHNDHYNIYNTTLSTHSERNTDTKQKSANRIQKSKKSNEKSDLTIGVKRKNYRTQPNIKIFSLSEIKRCTVKPKDNYIQESNIQVLSHDQNR